MNIADRKIHTLTELAASIRSVIEKNYTSSYWVKAEIAKVNHYPRSGHAYPELVEKNDNKVVAQFRSTIWANDFRDINNIFIEVTGEPLKDGMEILCRITVGFHAIYGLSLTIIEVEPSYTLGQMALEKTKTIEQLKQEGIFNNNKKLIFPLLPRKIAVVSVETSKGYSDYIEILRSFEGKYKLFNKLYPAILQGEQAIKTILQQLRYIKNVADIFDVVIIIRGGGGDIGLNCYNNYELAKELANFPIPVITGIGHSTNETVCEMVSHINKITPTDVAYFLLGHFEEYSQRIEAAKQNAIAQSKRIIMIENQKLNHIGKTLARSSQNLSSNNNNNISSLTRSLKIASNSLIKSQTSKTLLLENHIKLTDPINVLKRGYSISSINGEIIKSSKDLSTGQAVTTKLFDGSFESVISKTKKND
ncbi:MAG: exodeoxyribonuclease VII large subunit [Bacteroidetes bacterium]|nr:exodeoxyribonuclease VII large subunit [Bacteroidota bacterium]